jgi:23S rRNA (uracil1939-C5)-methyltransferase
MRMTPGEIEVRISAVAAGGAGIGRMPDGRVVFCDGALPGELVAARTVEDKKDFARAALVDVLEPSPARVDPPCPHVARGCGGCTWLHIAPAAAAAFKVDIVRDALRRLAKRGDIEVRSGPSVDSTGYRTGVRLAVDGDGRPAYRRLRSHDPVVVDTCLVAHPALEDLIHNARFSGATEVVLRVGASTGERLASPDRAARRAQVPGDTVVSTRAHPAAIRDQVAGREWRVSAGSFFQSGPQAAQLLVDRVRAHVEGGLHVADLYSGIGILGGSVTAGHITAVESNRSAVADARVNLADLDARIVTADVARYDGGPADLVIADPPRAGLGPGGCRTVGIIGAPRVVLISCDPASLARDVVLMAGHGYDVGVVEVLDLFPGTFHVESLTVFNRG